MPTFSYIYKLITSLHKNACEVLNKALMNKLQGLLLIGDINMGKY